MPGIGGLWRDCWACEGKGTVAVSIAVSTAPVFTNPMVQGVVDTTVESAIPSQPIVAKEVAVESVNKHESVEPLCMFPGYSDAVMTAILDEPRMSIVDWKNKYRGVSELFVVEGGVVKAELIGLRDRQAIRLAYAQSRPAAPRKVDLMKSQDMVANRDADYMLHVKAEEKLKAKK